MSYLDLSVNNLEKLPDAITSLIGLAELYLNDTFLDFLPANFGRLINLRILELRDNNLITLPKSMSRLQQLRRIDIGNNEFKELPEVIGSLVNLTELWCDGNRIRRITCNVANLKQMIHFDASNNLLQYLPGDIGNWQKCQELCVSSNELEELPFSIGLMKSLVTLKLDENQVQDLPESICQLEHLEEIMISHNDLFKLPSTIGLLRQLRFLTADENLLRFLPNEICSCSSLTILSVRGNKLTKIPPDIGRLTQLRVINVVNNFLTQLPVTILNLRQLSALWISDNQSQPLMPLQKEFNEHSQCYYLTCYLLPQVITNKEQSRDDANDVNELVIQQHHNNVPLNSSINGKRRICFASDPIQEVMTIDQTSRLMRSPTPYPKELRMMSKFATKNVNPQQQQQQQRHTDLKLTNQTNDTNESDILNEAQTLDDTGKPNHHQHMDSVAINGGNLPNIGDINDCHESTLKAITVEIKEARITTTAMDAQSQEPYHARDETYADNLSLKSSKSNGHFIPAHPEEVDFMPQTYQYAPAHNYDSSSEMKRLLMPLNKLSSLDQNCSNTNGKYIPNNQNDNIADVEHISQASPNISLIEQSNGIPDENIYEIRTNQVYSTTNSIRRNFYEMPSNYEQKPQPYQTVYYSTSNGQSVSNETNENQLMDNNHHDHHDEHASSTLSETGSIQLQQQYQFQDSQAQAPPPYHIAKAFTKKSKQDLLTYDIYRTNCHQLQTTDGYENHYQTSTTPLLTPTGLDTNSNGEDYGKNHNEEIPEPNHNISKSVVHDGHGNKSVAPSTPWLFGLHKTPRVVTYFLFQ